ncbi:MAG: GGDEF domain-containing protein [Candidatus Caenarcaniphilales bacterium]|nr:GGDEF domain-containing protein [Candidatus Caenarcaniphilales bacterium]
MRQENIKLKEEVCALKGNNQSLKEALRVINQSRHDGNTLKLIRQILGKLTSSEHLQNRGITESPNAAIFHQVLINRAKKLEKLAFYDALTQIPNRRKLNDVTDNFFASRAQREIAILLLDADHFRQFNDTLGHRAGDIALKAIALAMRISVSRQDDFVSRYGGEEFCVLLPDTSLTGAVKVGHTIQRNLKLIVQNFGKIQLDGHLDLGFFQPEISQENLEFYKQIVEAAREIQLDSLSHPASPVSSELTLSIGASYGCSDRDTFEILLQKADTRLYHAKNTGRNKVVSSIGTEFVPCNPIINALNFVIESGFLAMGAKISK